MSTILAVSTACQEIRLGTTSGKGYYSPNVRIDGFGATCSPLGLPPGAASTEGCWTFFVRKIHCTVPNYWSEQLIAGNKTEKPSDEQPTDQEHRPGDRANQAHRVQLTARSIISFGCLIVGEISFRLFCLLFFENLYSKVVVYSCDSNMQPALRCVENTTCSRDICL